MSSPSDVGRSCRLTAPISTVATSRTRRVRPACRRRLSAGVPIAVILSPSADACPFRLDAPRVMLYPLPVLCPGPAQDMAIKALFDGRPVKHRIGDRSAGKASCSARDPLPWHRHSELCLTVFPAAIAVPGLPVLADRASGWNRATGNIFDPMSGHRTFGLYPGLDWAGSRCSHEPT